LKENKLDLKDVVQMRVFLSDMNMFAEVNKAYSVNFGLKPPSRLCISLGGTN
jgi:enamine deaminase RidA (YjgF/YER057c/UK114 family)